MQEYDKLSPELRAWISSAILPWRPRSVQRVFDKAFARTRNTASALLELDRLQERRVAEDGVKVWGKNYPMGPDQFEV